MRRLADARARAPRRGRAAPGWQADLAEVLCRLEARHWRERCCPACGGPAEPRPCLSTAALRYHRCQACAHRFAPRVPEDAVLRALYASTGVGERRRAALRASAEADLPRLRRLAAGLAAKAPARRRAIEVGCGAGPLVRALADVFDHAIGCELDPTLAADAARRFGIDVRPERLESLPLEAGSVDLVVFNDVLDHLNDPAAVLAAARRLLAPRGLCWVSVPNGGALASRAMAPSHVNLFDAGALVRVARHAGFRILVVGGGRTGLARTVADKLASRLQAVFIR